VDQCRDGLKDPASYRYYRKRTALDVNDPIFAEELAKDGQRCHEGWQHEPIIGTTVLTVGVRVTSAHTTYAVVVVTLIRIASISHFV
jgi:hypothetical protein